MFHRNSFKWHSNDYEKISEFFSGVTFVQSCRMGKFEALISLGLVKHDINVFPSR